MKFWDTSALVPLFVEEATTDSLRRTIAEDPDVVIWALTHVELASVMWRRKPEPPAGRAELARQAAASVEEWDAVLLFQPVIERALNACKRHQLRSADALQLSSPATAFRRIFPSSPSTASSPPPPAPRAFPSCRSRGFPLRYTLFTTFPTHVRQVQRRVRCLRRPEPS